MGPLKSGGSPATWLTEFAAARHHRPRAPLRGTLDGWKLHRKSPEGTPEIRATCLADSVLVRLRFLSGLCKARCGISAGPGTGWPRSAGLAVPKPRFRETSPKEA